MTDSKNAQIQKAQIAVLGGGQIGEALVSGLVASGMEASQITVTNRSKGRQEELAQAYGVETTDDNLAAVDGADYVFVCVKPYALVDMLEQVADKLHEKTVVVSMAAGVTLEKMEAAVAAAGEDVPVVRVMPNTPMLVGAGMCAVAGGTHATDENLAGVRDLLESVGEVLVIEEAKMDAAGAVAGSAPAYFFLIAEALIDAAVQQGLTRAEAEKLVTFTASGAGRMLVDSGRGPAELRAGVSSPGGTTVEALRELEESGLRGAFYRAVDKAVAKSASLA